MKKGIENGIEKVTKNKTLNEFKEFISKGNILDMAIGVVMGTAFKDIINSVVDIIMSMIGLVIGTNFENLTFTIKDATIAYGAFIQNVIDFLVIAVCLFMVIKIMAAFHRKKEEEVKEEIAAEPEKSDEVKLLEEIRDLMKK